MFSDYIKGFRFKELFNDLGWDLGKTSIPSINVDNETYQSKVVAEKSGFKIISCEVNVIPSYAIRHKIANTLKKLIHESIIIFTDSTKEKQVWLYTYIDGNRPKKAEFEYNSAQDTERLYQRASGLIFTLDEQDEITIVDVSRRVKNNFAQNAEKVTKKFYDSFKKQHTALLKFMDGIEIVLDKEWYASIMLNRLMFCYFMQKRGFLNDDKHYLRKKLEECKAKIGKGNFYSFYRSFLLELFQKGFGTSKHTPEIVEMIGRIPYLNGGLFDLHEIEQKYSNINIHDEAFEKIFDLFDQYEWHLDSRYCASGKEINPDVLGYIFEKYINDRAQMGAYYTQEDITDYISRNSILPYLLEAAKAAYPKVFLPDGEVWTLLRNSGDEYIFHSVKYGVYDNENKKRPLPSSIEIGLDTKSPDLLERRKDWNKSAPSEYALPTEIWREVIERRKRYEEVSSLIRTGKITQINDFITYNLDITNFVADLLDTIDDPKFIQEFYKNLCKITVLDPTCGSGAFLFAALNILEPLYNVCLSRMSDYLAHNHRNSLERGIHKFFSEKLALMENEIHPNKKYFIYKSIILNNLYGVDYMREAAETAKLRLFLKLVSTANPDYNQKNIGIEPLPDIDFNIKAGNVLIGFANKDEIKTAFYGDVFAQQLKDETMDAMSNLSKAVLRYKQWQLGEGDCGSDDFTAAKKELTERQTKLKATLDKLLQERHYKGVSGEKWQIDYMPFHWVAEFYSIVVENKGFDVIIGNPPYVEYKDVNYEIKDYETFSSKAIHAFCVERSIKILSQQGNISMILPMSLVSTQRMKILQSTIQKNRNTYYSNFSWRPGRLFESVNRAFSIFIAIPKGNSVFTTSYQKWYSEARNILFDKMSYCEMIVQANSFWVPKLSANIENEILSKILKKRQKLELFLQNTQNKVFYRTTGGLYWKVFTDFAPRFCLDGTVGRSSRETTFSLSEKEFVHSAISLLSSTTFWWWYTITSNLRDLNPSDITLFHVDETILRDKSLQTKGQLYTEDLERNSSMLQRIQKNVGTTETQSFKIQKSKAIIDEIDFILAKHYDFTQEELDYIINYDIKYRMGGESGESDDE